MSSIISLPNLLQFLIFISIISISISIESQLQFAFFNGFNVIRCSDDQVQVYQTNLHSTPVFTQILNCNNNPNVFHPGYSGYLWNKFRLICSSQSNQVHEEQVIKRGFKGHQGMESFPDMYGQLGHSKELYALHIEPTDDEEMTIIRSDDQPVNNAYYNQNSNPVERRIYIWFSNHPILCRIRFSSDENNPCVSNVDQEVENVEYTCYYNPGADQEPTIKEMEAELKQIEETDDKPENSDAYILNLHKPDIPEDDPSKPNTNHSSHSHSNQQPHKKPPAAKHPSQAQTKSSILKTIGLILGILLLLAVIGGMAFYVIQKHRFNKSSPGSIEHGDNRGLSSVISHESHQSLANDQNIEIAMNEPSKTDKPNLKLQTLNANKRQRTGTNMVFNEDI